MKRKHAFAALIPELALSLSACGGSPVPAESEDTPDTPPVSEPVGSQLPEGALVIAEQGMFSSGVTVTEPVEGEYDETANWLELERHGNTAHVGHANVLCQIPAEETGLPMVYLHGYGQSHMGWMTTPDDGTAGPRCSCKRAAAPFWWTSPDRARPGPLWK